MSFRLGVEALEDRAVPALFINASTDGDFIVVEHDEVIVHTPTETRVWDISGESAVQIDALNGNDTVQVNAVAAGRFVGIDAGKDNDVVLVCPDSQNLGYIQGYLGVGGNVGYDQLIVSDQAWEYGDTYTITAQTIRVQSIPNLTIGYGGFENFELTTGGGPDTVLIESTAPGATYYVGTGGGNDVVAVLSVAPTTTYFVDTGADNDTFKHLVGFASNWQITGLNQGLVLGWGSFVSAENLTSGVGNDTFNFLLGSGLTGTLDGGAGADTLIAPFGTPIGAVVNIP